MAERNKHVHVFKRLWLILWSELYRGEILVVARDLLQSAEHLEINNAF